MPPAHSPPRPPEAQLGCAPTSGVAAGAALICLTTTRPGEPATATVSCAPVLGRSTGVNTLGRSDSTAGPPATRTLRSALPAYTGRIAITAPPATLTSVTS